jgi:hypothetical protein
MLLRDLDSFSLSSLDEDDSEEEDDYDLFFLFLRCFFDFECELCDLLCLFEWWLLSFS